MDATEAVVRFLVGGALITFVSFLGETDYKIFSGLLVLFPIVTLTGFYFISVEVPLVELREIVLFSILGVPTVWGFTVGFYLATSEYDVPISLLIGVIGWLAVALIIVILVNRWTAISL